MLVLAGFFEIERLKYCIYAIVALSFVLILQVKLTLLQIMAIACFLTSSMISLSMDASFFSSWIVTVASIFFAVFAFKRGISPVAWKLVKFSTYVNSLSFILYMLFHPETNINNSLLLFFENPNMTGIATVAPAMILVVMLCDPKRRTAYKVCDFLLLTVLSYMVYATQNRGSFISLLLVMVAALFATSRKRSRRICSPVCFAIFKLTPILVMFIYIAMFLVLPGDIEFLGKPLFSGREGAWLSSLQNLFATLFPHQQFEEGTLNLFLEGAARYGTIAMVGYFLLLISFGKTKDELKSMGVANYVAYIAFHCCLFQQSFESTLLTGSYTIHIWSFLLIGIASMGAIGTKRKETIAV